MTYLPECNLNLRKPSEYLNRYYQYAQRVIHTGLIGAEARRALILAQLFAGVNAYLKSLGVAYWIDCGTLLGWHRENRLLLHDKDIDFGMMETDYEHIWRSRQLLPKGFRIYNTSRYHHGPKLYVSYKGFDADLYFHRIQDRKIQCLVKEPNPRYMIPRPLDWYLPLQQVIFLGQSTNIPCEPEKYLTDLYGYLGPGAVFNRSTNLWEAKITCGKQS